MLGLGIHNTKGGLALKLSKCLPTGRVLCFPTGHLKCAHALNHLHRGEHTIAVCMLLIRNDISWNLQLKDNFIISVCPCGGQRSAFHTGFWHLNSVYQACTLKGLLDELPHVLLWTQKFFKTFAQLRFLSRWVSTLSQYHAWSNLFRLCSYLLNPQYRLVTHRTYSLASSSLIFLWTVSSY